MARFVHRPGFKPVELPDLPEDPQLVAQRKRFETAQKLTKNFLMPFNRTLQRAPEYVEQEEMNMTSPFARVLQRTGIKTQQAKTREERYKEMVDLYVSYGKTEQEAKTILDQRIEMYRSWKADPQRRAERKAQNWGGNR